MLHYMNDNTAHMDSETEPNMPMPPPKQVATSLKKMAFDSVQEWRNKFGVAYKKLDLAYNYLQTCKKVIMLVTFQSLSFDCCLAFACFFRRLCLILRGHVTALTMVT